MIRARFVLALLASATFTALALQPKSLIGDEIADGVAKTVDDPLLVYNLKASDGIGGPEQRVWFLAAQVSGGVDSKFTVKETDARIRLESALTVFEMATDIEEGDDKGLTLDKYKSLIGLWPFYVLEIENIRVGALGTKFVISTEVKADGSFVIDLVFAESESGGSAVWLAQEKADGTLQQLVEATKHREWYHVEYNKTSDTLKINGKTVTGASGPASFEPKDYLEEAAAKRARIKAMFEKMGELKGLVSTPASSGS